MSNPVITKHDDTEYETIVSFKLRIKNDNLLRLWTNSCLRVCLMVNVTKEILNEFLNRCNNSPKESEKYKFLL